MSEGGGKAGKHWPSADAVNRNLASAVMQGTGITVGETGIKTWAVAWVGADQHVKGGAGVVALAVAGDGEAVTEPQPHGFW